MFMKMFWFFTMAQLCPLWDTTGTFLAIFSIKRHGVKQLPVERELGFSLVQQEETLCLCSPESGCASVSD